MLEKILSGDYPTVSTPCNQVVEIIEELKAQNKSINVAEIGVGIGATALEIVKRLDEKDNYYMFSYEEDVNELKGDLEKLDFCKVPLHAHGNSKKIYDAYSWSMANLYLSSSEKEIFDVVYLDGAHTFFHDGVTCCLLKKMCRPGAIIVFDDIAWSFSNSATVNPTKNPSILKHYTQEQINTYQIAMVVDIFMKDDEEWELVEDKTTKYVATYRRRIPRTLPQKIFDFFGNRGKRSR